MFNPIIDSIIISLLSGLVASFMIFFLFYKWKPIVVVSNKIAFNSNNDLFKVKIVNKTKVPIHDVSYELLKCHDNGDGIVNIESCEPLKQVIYIINKYDKKDKEAKYAVRISYKNSCNDIINWLNQDNNYLVFNITAKHSFSGGTNTFSQKYYKSDIVNGIFEIGISTQILKI